MRRMSIRLQFCSGGRTAERNAACANASEAHRRNRFASCGKPDASTWLIASSTMNRSKRPQLSLQLEHRLSRKLNGYCYIDGLYFLPEKRNGSRRKNFSHFQKISKW